MIIENIFKRDADKLMNLLFDLRPGWNVQVMEGDVNLFKLGFVNDIPCSVQIDITEEDAEELREELYDMETDAYIHEELLDIPMSKLSDKEKEQQCMAKQDLDRYQKYSWLERYF